MKYTKKGIIIDNCTLNVCHNPKCKKKQSQMTETHLCKNCKYIQYCSPLCREEHWNTQHKYLCKALLEINFVEALILEARCPLIFKYGLHKHPKILNDKIALTQSQVNYHIKNLATKDTIFSCQCNCKIGNIKNVSGTVMIEKLSCLNFNIVHVYVRCKNNRCTQRKNAQPLYDLYPLSSSQRIFVVIPNQKIRPEAIEFVNNNSKNIGTLPDDYDKISVEVDLLKNCSECISVHLLFKITAEKTKNKDENDNNNIKYIFNDNKDKWEEIN